MATGLSVSNTSNLTSGQKILIAAAKLAYEPAAPDPDLIASTRIPTGTKQWDLLTYARLADAAALTEGIDLTQTQQLVAASVTITPDEHGILATLSKRLMRRQGDTPVVSTTGAMISNSLRRRHAKDVIALYDGFSKSAPGAGSALDVTHFRGANAYLMTDNDSAYGPGQPPFHAALHIEQISDIIVDITDTAPRGTTTGLSGDMLQRWWRTRDRLYGVEVFHSGNIARDSGDDAIGAIFAKEALHTVMANDAEPTEETDNSLRATEYGVFQEWSEAEVADPHGVEIKSDAAATV